MTPRNRAADAAKKGSPPLLPVIPSVAARPRAVLPPPQPAARPTTLYDLALALTETLSDANPHMTYGIALPRRKTVFDLLRSTVAPNQHPVFHLVVRDDACLLEFLREFSRDAHPCGWDALHYAFTTNKPETEDALIALQARIDITLTTIHVNAWGERSAVWSFPSSTSGNRTPKLADAQMLLFDRVRRLLAPCDNLPAPP